MNFTKEVFSKTRKYTSDCGRYYIRWERRLSSKPCYILYLNDANGTYLATYHHLDFAKKNAERHSQTGRLIGQWAPSN